jgi:hypothetical protein
MIEPLFTNALGRVDWTNSNQDPGCHCDARIGVDAAEVGALLVRQGERRGQILSDDWSGISGPGGDSGRSDHIVVSASTAGELPAGATNRGRVNPSAVAAESSG